MPSARQAGNRLVTPSKPRQDRIDEAAKIIAMSERSSSRPSNSCGRVLGHQLPRGSELFVVRSRGFIDRSQLRDPATNKIVVFVAELDVNTARIHQVQQIVSALLSWHVGNLRVVFTNDCVAANQIASKDLSNSFIERHSVIPFCHLRISVPTSRIPRWHESGKLPD